MSVIRLRAWQPSLAALVTAAATLAPATAAYAADAATIGDVQVQLAGCAGTVAKPTAITLTADISSPATSLTVPCVARIDLDGHQLTVSGVTVSSGDDLTIDDDSSGTVGTFTASGVGATGGVRVTSSRFAIDGGLVVASTVAATSAGRLDVFGGSLRANDAAALGVSGITLGDGGVVAVSAGSLTTAGGFGAPGVAVGQDGAVLVAGGSLTATGGNGGAGVAVGVRGLVITTDGALAATGGTDSAGVAIPATGRVTVAGGTVTAAGGSSGAGIGSGLAAAAGQVEISAGSVVATGGSQASGVGAGRNGTSGPLVMSGGALTASAPADGTALGVDAGSGPLKIQGGTLRLPSGTVRLPDVFADLPELAIGTRAFLDGSAPGDGPTTYAVYTGAGELQNSGVIRVPEEIVNDVEITRDYHRVTFDTRGGTPTAGGPFTVLAPSFTSAGVAFPAAPSKSGVEFAGWNTKPDGSGAAVTASGQLPGSASGGGPAEITAYAVFVVRPPQLTATLSSAAPRSPEGFYRTPVTVRYRCTRGTLPLASACPGPVTLAKEGRGQSVVRSVSDTGGHPARSAVRVNIDRTLPDVSVTGVRSGSTYDSPRTVGCRVSDRLSGKRTCVVVTMRSGKRVDYRLRGVDRAGNVRVVRGFYRLR